MRISDWSSDVCSSDLCDRVGVGLVRDGKHFRDAVDLRGFRCNGGRVCGEHDDVDGFRRQRLRGGHALGGGGVELAVEMFGDDQDFGHGENLMWGGIRSEEHTSELQSLMRISYAVFCLKKKK